MREFKTFRYLIAVCLAVFALAASAQELDRDWMEEKDIPEYDQLRDPFWPIGHTRKIIPKVEPSKGETKTVAPVKIEPKWPKLKLKAITSSPKGYIAIIEGIGLVEAGQTIRMKDDNVMYSWKISEISEKGFACVPLTAEVAP